MRQVITAVSLLFILNSCGPECSNDFHTAGHDHYSEVRIQVEGPGLEGIEWNVFVILSDVAQGADNIRIEIEDANCSTNAILLRSYILEEGSFDVGTDSVFWLSEPCSSSSEQTWWPNAEGSVSFVREDGEVTITFESLVLTNMDPLPEEPPGLSSVSLDGEYRAPVYCERDP